MAASFLRGQVLGPKDLDIYTTNASGKPINAVEISFALYDYTTGYEVLLGPAKRNPVNPEVGHYYAHVIIPGDANLGAYRIRWAMREFVGGPLQSVVQEFDVVDRAVSLAPKFSPAESDLVRRLRVMLRDNNPDKNYKFRPPAHESTVSQYNRVFGYVWEDEELVESLSWALDMISAAPPETPFRDVDMMVNVRPNWRTLLLTGAGIHALQALQINWIADEFGYSIGGISLDLDKSSKYEAAKQSMTDLFDKQLERAKATVKIIKGLKQSKYGMGIRSSFGPHTGSGVLTPRKFMGI